MSIFISVHSFFFNDTAPTEIYTLSLHDALPILHRRTGGLADGRTAITTTNRPPVRQSVRPTSLPSSFPRSRHLDRKSTRLNSSHMSISYAVFCLKKKKKIEYMNAYHYFNHYESS